MKIWNLYFDSKNRSNPLIFKGAEVGKKSDTQNESNVTIESSSHEERRFKHIPYSYVTIVLEVGEEKTKNLVRSSKLR
jgi:hypothetical protein